MSKVLQILDVTSVWIDPNFFNLTAINRIKNDPYWVDFIEEGFRHADVGIQILPFDKIDLTKKWLINVDIKQWLWENKNINLLDMFDERLANEIKFGNAYLILNHQCESFTQTFFYLFYENIKDQQTFPFHKIVYMVAAVDAEKEYEKFLKKNNLSYRIKIIYCHHVYKRFKHDTNLDSFVYDRHRPKLKKYLCLNRRWRDHRLMLVSLLSSKNLLNDGYVSLGVEKNEIDEAKTQLLNHVDEKSLLFSGFEKISELLPLKTDDVDLRINHFGLNTLPIDFYKNSCFSVVSSTFAFEYQEPSAGFTEKEIKPILAKHPFIIINRPGILKEMKRLGFLTFEPWFDETYDLIENDNDRLTAIVNEIERLCKISFEEWDKILDQMSPVLEHNYSRLVNYNNEHCFYNSDLKKLLYYAE
jgi:hypothetical protein